MVCPGASRLSEHPITPPPFGRSCEPPDGRWMEGDVGQWLAACGTSNGWSTLEAVAAKVSKRAGRTVTPRELDTLMVAVGEETLLSFGIWRTCFGTKYMPIVVVNPSFARAAQEALKAGRPLTGCTCGATAPRDVQRDVQRNLGGSHDYNAGRHACTASAHKGWCLSWRPPSSGHLHSWRRRFT